MTCFVRDLCVRVSILIVSKGFRGSRALLNSIRIDFAIVDDFHNHLTIEMFLMLGIPWCYNRPKTSLSVLSPVSERIYFHFLP